MFKIHLKSLLSKYFFGASLFLFFVSFSVYADTSIHQSSIDVLQESTQLCPHINLFTGADDSNHWYSPAQLNNDDQVPNQCNTCRAPANRTHKSCGVSNLLGTTQCKGQSCRDRQGLLYFFRQSGKKFSLQHDLRYQNPVLFSRAQGEGCRFILWALDPVIGIEDINGRSISNYWKNAYLASQHLVEPPFPIGSVGFVIQSALTRGQHQLHIHIGTLQPVYAKAVATLSTQTTLTQHLQVNEYDFLVRFVPNLEPDAPFKGYNVFDIAANMLPANEQDMPRFGLLATISSDRTGVFLMAALGLDRKELNYAQPYTCAMRE